MFVWNASKNLLMFPAQLMEQNSDTYRYTSGWQGALILNVHKDTGINKQAEITHIDMSEISQKRKEQCERYAPKETEVKCYTHITTGEEICQDPEESYRHVPEYCFAEFDDSAYLAQNMWSFHHNFVDRILYIGDVVYTLSDAMIQSNSIGSYDEIDSEKWK